jgi:hypothetical protein
MHTAAPQQSSIHNRDLKKANSPTQPKSMAEMSAWLNNFQGQDRVTVKVCLAAIFLVCLENKK